LRGDYDEIVVVDNGELMLQSSSLEVAKKYGADYIDGHQGSSPMGQNLGLTHLANKSCEVILKSDDDVRYEKNYVTKLVGTFLKYHPCAVAGTCWNNDYPRIVTVHGGDGGWYDSQGVPTPRETLIMTRFEDHYVLKMHHLHGAFLYNVEDALKLAQWKRDLRKGAFPEYFSIIAHREETEFTMCLKHVTGKDLLYDTSAISFHYYAPGGIRKFDVNRLQESDDRRFEGMMEKLGVYHKIDPSDYEVVECQSK